MTNKKSVSSAMADDMLRQEKQKLPTLGVGQIKATAIACNITLKVKDHSLVTRGTGLFFLNHQKVTKKLRKVGK